ncbi:Cof-type HAD-IIB family hydrolase [Candidatus Galacturonibacter soehngenii]|uniref:HAD family phosphatase n=1 Tax=Candidatus Galacturonatibacter soehngenii TaxID=2307010 RepID=A0A7V7QMB8_9FIRM|nr:Cof-type HAD-IIB family hydrolase [Candidatus Galacturonibacter soehngenii]KAB1439794.1 HAD family phosphatase [Candidatus Galacturonibacter soehngenii]MBA4685969.1 HAD family phosphatase [Candidatus Galacturonibacter soehngenii]
MAYEILVLDIDGTLTNSNKEISDVTKKAIREIQDRGHHVVLASGRPTAGILPIAKELNLEMFGGYVLSFNGAKVINCKTKEIIFQNTIPSDLIADIYKAAEEEDVSVISYDDKSIITSSKIDEYMEKESKINHMPIKVVEDFVSYLDFPVNKCLMTGDPDYLAQVEKRMKERFGDRLSIYRSEPFFLEIMPLNIDKAHSLEKLLDKLHMSREQMISCGDGYNDLTMIQYAGKGVAMGNAQKEIQEAADYITLTNDEDGVAHVIDKFMLAV